ncbi:MAG: DUF5780 domain-containing protein [Clostridium sp.]
MKKIKLLLLISTLSVGLVSCGGATKEEISGNLEQNNYNDIIKDYEGLSEVDRKEIDGKIQDELLEIVEKFIESGYTKDSFEDSMKKIDSLKVKGKEDSINEIAEKLKELFDISEKSVNAHNTGIELLEKKEFEKALIEFKKVSANHPIYKETKVKMELATKELEKIKPAPVKIVGSRLEKNIIDNQVINVQFENKSDKVVKEIQFSVFGYDKDGYPVKVQFNTDDYLNCKIDQTIQPGQKSKNDWTWDLYNTATKITQVKVSIVTVEFYDGETWENPTHASDVEKYAGKPLEKK